MSPARIHSVVEKHQKVHMNLDVTALLKRSIEKGEGTLSKSGALHVTTGKYTGRSPNDKFIVDDPEVHDRIAWGKVNIPISRKKFDAIYDKMVRHMEQRDELFIFDGFAGADRNYSVHVRVINELASQNLFIHTMLRRPTEEELHSHRPEFTIVCAPGCTAEPELHGVNSEAFILMDFKNKLCLIGGTGYAGEIKKSVFTFMNYVLPLNSVFPMHCSANTSSSGSTALFFGLSGTGKTTLSADPELMLIGDDEHGWSPDGIFNIEGGCYAKCINLDKAKEPQIWDAIRRGAIVENVVMHPTTREFDFGDASLTENTRASYPLEHIPNAVLSGIGGHPKTVIFLTADAFGVLPPISLLDPSAAAYHFMSGYTSKLAGTERGITEPKAAFSACFGEPFMPLHIEKYAEMLRRRIKEHSTRVFLVNTGWSGGPYGVGKRMDIDLTRAMVRAALAGALETVTYTLHPVFNLMMPVSCAGVPSEVLNPRNTWQDKKAYDRTAEELAKMFEKNFERFPEASVSIVKAGPKSS